MKQSQVKPGVRAMLSLGGRRGAVAVTVVHELLARHWLVVDSLGRERAVTARRLQPMPAPVALCKWCLSQAVAGCDDQCERCFADNSLTALSNL